MIFNSVVAGVIVARWLGAQGVGELAVINVAVTTIVQLGSFGLPSSNTYFIAKDLKHFRAATINSLLFALLAGSPSRVVGHRVQVGHLCPTAESGRSAD